MVANIRGFTPNYNFKLINFDTPRWHTLEYANWNMVDAMFLQGGTPQIRGVWTNNTSYLIGDRTFDEETSATYRCLVEHTSALSGTFEADRTTNPTYWSLQLAGTPVYRGEWLDGATYVLGDIVEVDDYAYYLCTLAHISSATFPADAAKWQKVFDATVVVADAEAAKAAAYGFANAAATSAANALTSENNAETAETDAENWADDARAASGAFRWAFSTSTTATDPAAGRIAFNNATPTAVTEIYLSAQSGETGNPDVSSWVVTWDDSTNPNTRGTLQLRKVGAPEEFLIFNLTNNITDNGSWLRLPVAYVSHSGSLANAEPLSVGFVRAGNAGPTGTGGGDMLKANNLSDVASIPTSRTNLGLGTAQIPTFSQVLLGNAPSAAMHAATKTYVDSSPSLYISDTAPAGVQDGSLWWDSDRGTLLVRYNDGSSVQWVDAVATPGLDTSGFVQKAGSTMTGDLTIDKNAATITLKQPVAHNQDFSKIDFTVNNKLRWEISGAWGVPGTNSPSDIGGNFSIDRYNDAGEYMDSPIMLFRENNNVQLNHILLVGNMLIGGVIQASTEHLVIGGGGGNIYLRPQDSSVQAAEVIVTSGGNLIANMLSTTDGWNGGLQCKDGTTNTLMSNWTNFAYNGAGGIYAYIDLTYLGTITLTSDYRIKKDVIELPTMWDTVKALRPIKYTHTDYSPPAEATRLAKEAAAKNTTPEPWLKGDDVERWGFVAHELQETLVESAATGVKDQADCIQSPNVMTVVAALTKALQEAMARIEALENA